MPYHPRGYVTTVVLVFCALLASPGQAAADLNVLLVPKRESGQRIGTVVKLSAVTRGSEARDATFQFSYRMVGGPSTWRLLRDFDAIRTFQWASLEEGLYELRVVARAVDEVTTAESVVPFLLIPRTLTSYPTVARTKHPLVALYSAPSCATGFVRVRFAARGTQFWTYTPYRPCGTDRTINFYIAGMRPDTTYVIQQENVQGLRVERGPSFRFRTRSVLVTFDEVTVDTFTAEASVNEGILLANSVIGPPERVGGAAYDMFGGLVWYYPGLLGLTQAGSILPRPVAGGTFLVVLSNIYRKDQVLREVDLAGNTVRETNVVRIGEQLAALGYPRPGSLHHEALRLPNGHTLVIASLEQFITFPGDDEPTDVYGEMVIDLDENLQVSWVWNAFDHLDVNRRAGMRETCFDEAPGCPPLYLASVADDWLHMNAINYVPEDGSLLLSVRHQDWVIKIDYGDGTGTGEVVWRLGQDGDFTLSDPSGDVWPWFSHQHDARLIGNTLIVYDNGNTRVTSLGGGNSRGQVYELDEAARTATLVHNIDLGNYAFALGSAQPLSNGNYHFLNGVVSLPTEQINESVEVTPDGSVAWRLRGTGGVYRSHRMRDLYQP